VIVVNNSGRKKKRAPCTKGLALAMSSASAPQILCDQFFRTRRIDVFDTKPSLPVVARQKGFSRQETAKGIRAPFGIQNIGGQLYVTFAKQDSAKA